MDKVIQEMKRGDDDFLIPKRFIDGLTADLMNLPDESIFEDEPNMDNIFEDDEDPENFREGDI